MNALVTGASSGIGRALSIELCREEYKVIGIGRNENALQEVKSICGEGFNYLVADLSKVNEIKKVIDIVGSRYSSLDLLVNNAGYGLYKGILEMTLEEIIDMTSVNFIAPIALIKGLLPYMSSGSVVVNVITAGVFVLMTKLPTYGATKVALHYASEALRRELKAMGIHLINIYPGVVNTGFHSRAGSNPPIKGIPPEKVAREIIKAVKSRKKNVFIPRYVALGKILGPLLPPLY